MQEESTDECELSGIHSLLIDDRLTCFEEIVIIWLENILVYRYSIKRSNCVTNVETISVGYLRVVLVRDQSLDFENLMHLFQGSALGAMVVLYRLQHYDERVIVLLHYLIQEISSLLDVTSEIKLSHVSFPFNELVFDQFELLQEF